MMSLSEIHEKTERLTADLFNATIPVASESVIPLVAPGSGSVTRYTRTLLHQPGPVLPLPRNFHQHAAHDCGAGHKSVALALENPHFASSHGLAEPFDILDRDSCVSSSMMDDHRASDINIPK